MNHNTPCVRREFLIDLRHMQQVVHIHGGEPFTNKKEFFAYWQKQSVDDPFVAKEEQRWRRWLAGELEGTFAYAALRMPCKMNAQHDAWKMWFEKHIPFFKDDIILIGHSLGGNFLAKYLSEHTLPVRIAQLHIVASPFGVATFTLPDSLEGVKAQCPAITLYYSKDDTVVPFAESEKYQNALPEAERVVFADRNHFEQPTFPELRDRLLATR